MALTFKVDASAGDIWCNGISDGGQLVVLSTLRTYQYSHNHSGDNIFLNSVSEARGVMPVYIFSTHAACTPRSATSSGGAGASYASALPTFASRNHGHANSTVAGSAIAMGVGGPAVKADDQVFFESNGEITCDRICTVAGASCYCPANLYGLYDDHSHALAGNFADFVFAYIPIADAGNTSKTYFHIATDGAGTGALWDTAWTHGYGASATHNHSSGGLSLAAYSAPAGSAGSKVGSPRTKVAHATGYIFVHHDVNVIGMKEYYDDLYSHLHVGGGASSSYGPTYAQVFSINNGDSYRYFETSAGVYQQLEVYSAAHTHTLGMS